MDTRSVFVTIAGRANAGKSSLLNKLVGEKIAMVTDKPDYSYKDNGSSHKGRDTVCIYRHTRYPES